MIVRLVTADGDALLIDDDCIAEPGARAELTLDVGPGRFHPGLINAHDHLHRNHYPRLGSPPYRDAYDWGADLHARFAREIAHAKQLDRRDALLFGAFKNVIGGVTTVVHHDAWEPEFDGEFPLRVAKVRTVHSLGLETNPQAAIAVTPAPPDSPLCIHLAEGTNEQAAQEVAQLAGLGLLDERLVAVHVVGVDAAGIARLLAGGAAIVWCPTSNLFLLGATAPRALFDSGVDVLLGTDSLLTGAGTLLDELRVARAFGYLDDERLLASVRETAARRLGLPVPSLAPGSRADVILLRAPLLEASAADVALVVVGGRMVLADAAVAAALPAANQPASSATELLEIGGVRKSLPAPLARAAARALAHNPDLVPVVTCDPESNAGAQSRGP